MLLANERSGEIAMHILQEDGRLAFSGTVLPVPGVVTYDGENASALRPNFIMCSDRNASLVTSMIGR